MTDKDKWAAGGLFVLGVAGAVGGLLLEGLGTAPVLVGIAISMAGFVGFGLATATFIRWRTGTVTPKRVGAAVGVFVGIGVASLGNIYLDGTEKIVTMVAGVVLVGVAMYWNHKLVAEKDVVIRDERVDLLSYKASFRAYQLLILTLAIWFWFRQLSIAQVSVDTVIIGLLLAGIFTRTGFYRYYTQHQ